MLKNYNICFLLLNRYSTHHCHPKKTMRFEKLSRNCGLILQHMGNENMFFCSRFFVHTEDMNSNRSISFVEIQHLVLAIYQNGSQQKTFQWSIIALVTIILMENLCSVWKMVEYSKSELNSGEKLVRIYLHKVALKKNYKNKSFIVTIIEK